MSLMRVRELKEERAQLWEQAKAIHEEAGDQPLTDEKRAEWDRLNERIEKLGADARDLEARHERARELEEEMRQKSERITKAENPETRKKGAEQVVEDYRAALHRYWEFGRDGLTSEDRQTLNDPEIRALATQTKGTNGSGGFTVPTDFRAELFDALKAYGGMRQAARILTTDNGRNLQIPRSDDTGNTAKLIAEATAITDSTHVPFGQVTLEAHKYRVGPIKISRELFQDSALDIDAIVRSAIAVRFGRATNNHYTVRSSTESTGPHGIVNDSTGAVAVATGSTNITPEVLIDLIHSVDPAYRPGARWMMNDTLAKGIRKIRWGSSAPFAWQPSMQAGQPDLLFGYPVIINQDVASFGTSGNKPVWFGDFSYYLIRDVQAVDLMRLEERYAEEDVVALLAFMRTDGRAVLPSTVPSLKPYRCIVQSTG